MSRFSRVPAKAYEIRLAKLSVIVSPAAREALRSDSATAAAYGEFVRNDRLVVTAIKGNKKFELTAEADLAKFRAVLEKANAKAKVRAAAEEKKDKAESAAWEKKRAAEEKARAAAYRAALAVVVKASPLPLGLVLDDLIAPKDRDARLGSSELGRAIYGNADYNLDHVEIWLVERFGWVVPTLTIRNAPQGRDAKRRTYAVSLADGKLCRVGLGPHVKKAAQIYLTKENAKRLEALVERVVAGSIAANEYRDDLSTSRARNAGRRSRFGF